MRRLLSLAFIFALPLAATGCDFYFGGGGGDDDDPCLYPPQPEPGGAAYELRNPDTGLCEAWGGSGGWCDDSCGPCPQYDYAPEPTWGYCESECSGLDETTCLATDGCRGGYVDICPPNADCDLEGSLGFYECWATDRSGPVRGGECWGLDAWDCSQHDDCRSVHSNPCLLGDGNCLGDFSFCVPEPEAKDDGNCWEEVTCDSIGPDCPGDYVAGVTDGCWSGVCIPLEWCEPPPACDALAEMACIDRLDCAALYEGVDCTCDDTGCDCADWLFDGCQSGDLPTP